MYLSIKSSSLSGDSKGTRILVNLIRCWSHVWEKTQFPAGLYWVIYRKISNGDLFFFSNCNIRRPIVDDTGDKVTGISINHVKMNTVTNSLTHSSQRPVPRDFLLFKRCEL